MYVKIMLASELTSLFGNFILAKIEPAEMPDLLNKKVVCVQRLHTNSTQDENTYQIKRKQWVGIPVEYIDAVYEVNGVQYVYNEF